MYLCVFITFYTQTYECFHCSLPTVRRTVKMHLLEDHATELVEATKMGFGSMSEQGAEAIHAQFNSLMMTDSCIHSVSSDDSIPWYGY